MPDSASPSPSAPVTGGCLCGSVRFRLRGPVLARRACWCRDCQFLSSGNASINLIVATEGSEITGETGVYESDADSGNRMRRSFCTRCGTPLFSASSGRPHLMVVRAGALDDPELGRPEGFIWTGSAPSWGLIDRDLECVAGQPGAPPQPRG